MGAKIRKFPLSFRIRRALCRRIVGPYVSGAIIRRDIENPATIKATQNVHLQLTVETNPEMRGDNCGPKVVALESSGWILVQSSRILTAIQNALARPLVVGSS